MRKCFFISVCLINFLFISSCDDDGYSLGDFKVEIASIKALDRNSFYVLLDNGEKLWPTNPVINYTPKKRQRTLVDYTLLSDSMNGFSHYVKINALRDILTKPVIDLIEENKDSIGDDPIKLLRYWIGDGFLNIEYTYNRGGEKIHYLNLVNNANQYLKN
ncbi:MAG: hypothetical protein ACLVKO_05370 [Dysgonomonas sp.]